MASCDQVRGKPGQEEPECRCYGELPDVDTPELTMLEEFGCLAPGNFRTLLCMFSQSASFANIAEFGFVDLTACFRIAIAPVPDPRPDNSHPTTDGKHHAPAKGRQYPCEYRRQKSQSDKLSGCVDSYRKC